MKIKFKPDQVYADIDHPVFEAATKHIPKWYKDIPQFIRGEKSPKIVEGTTSGNSTIKRCVPFLDAMTTGYILYLPDDVEVKHNPDGSPAFFWRTKDVDLVSFHNLEQFEGLNLSEEYYKNHAFKWNNSWGIQTPKGYSSIFLHPINKFDLPFLTLSGVVDTDNYELPVQFPFFIKKDFIGIIPRGTPVAQFLPFKRDSWDSEIEKFDPERVRKNQKKLFGLIDRSYKRQFWSKKSYK